MAYGMKPPTVNLESVLKSQENELLQEVTSTANTKVG
jgi:hypothetical protein